MIVFEHKGTDIINPTMSECGRFFVSPDYYGFTVYHTGGSCTAWHKQLEDGRYLLLTDNDDGCGFTHEFKNGDPIILGLYGEDGGEPISFVELTAGRE